MKLAIPIFLTLGMHIRPTKILKVGPLNARYELERRHYEGCINAKWGNKDEIERVMAADDNNNDNKEDL